MVKQMVEFIAKCRATVKAFKIDRLESWALADEISALGGYRESPAEIRKALVAGYGSIHGVRIVVKDA